MLTVELVVMFCLLCFFFFSKQCEQTFFPVCSSGVNNGHCDLAGEECPAGITE